jgi:uncharacterized protein (TIGR03437 family)
VFSLVRWAAAFFFVVVCGYSSQNDSAAALTPADLFPLKYTALFGGQVHIGGIAVDANGGAYITGIAFSALPVTAGAFQTDYKPATCISYIPNIPPQTYTCPIAFAGKLNSDGTALAYLTYLGSSNSIGNAISVDKQGNAWVTGTIYSSDLPVTPGAFQTELKGPENVFVLKLNSTGSRVLLATYLGGSGFDTPTSLTLDAGGNAYVAGSTSSRDFPVSPGAFQTDASQIVPGPNTSFVTKFDGSGRLVYSTYFHGGKQSGTGVSSIAADPSGNAYLAGTNRGGSLPTTPGAFQTNTTGLDAAFVAKLDATGSKLLYCTYLAANSQITGAEIALDVQGNAYVAGSIFLNIPGVPSSFPTTPGAFQTTMPVFPAQGTPSISFITKLNAAGSALIYSTFLYASSGTGIGSLVVDPSGSVVALGETYAFDFPTTPGALRQCNPMAAYGSTGFMLKLAPDGSHPVYSTYLGAAALSAVGMDGAGEIYIAGNNSGTLPIVPGSFGWNGAGAFVARLSPVALPAGSVSCVVSAASRGGRAIAPGEIVDIFGNGIGPAQMVLGSSSGGQIGMSLGGVQVLINGVRAPLLSAGPNQIRAVVPFEAGPSVLNQTGLANIQILDSSTTVQPFTVPIAALAPSIFTVDGRPTGQALMINEDGTLNSEQNWARQGSIVTIYATGLNNTQPALATGAIALDAAPLAFQSEIQIGGPVVLQIGGTSFGGPEITYAGAAPGFVAGLTQINFRVPVSFFHGFSGLYLSVPGPFSNQSGVYFYLQ